MSQAELPALTRIVILNWLAFEFLYLRAQINFPWLVLGNGFANDVMLIQWYEVTGALGGTLWVLLVNLAVFWLIKGVKASRTTLKSGSISLKAVLCPNRSKLIWVLGIFLVPLMISLVRFLTYEEKEDPYEMKNVIGDPGLRATVEQLRADVARLSAASL